MLDFKHARSRFGNRRRQPGNAAGPVTHVRGESPQPTVSGQAMVDHPVQNGRAFSGPDVFSTTVEVTVEAADRDHVTRLYQHLRDGGFQVIPSTGPR